MRDYFSTVLPWLADLPDPGAFQAYSRYLGRPAFIDASDQGKLLPFGAVRVGIYRLSLLVLLELPNSFLDE